MLTEAAIQARLDDAVVRLVRDQGSAVAMNSAQIASPRRLRGLADVLHHLVNLHARPPGLLAAAATARVPAAWHPVLCAAADAFHTERRWLIDLTAAAGPLPSTPGQAESEAALTAQMQAIDWLGRSERVGCAQGAAFAFCLDWQVIRAQLAIAGDALGVATPPSPYPDETEVRTALSEAEVTLPQSRATMFGAEQLVQQHAGMWRLLDARAAVRDSLP